MATDRLKPLFRSLRHLLPQIYIAAPLSPTTLLITRSHSVPNAFCACPTSLGMTMQSTSGVVACGLSWVVMRVQLFDALECSTKTSRLLCSTTVVQPVPSLLYACLLLQVSGGSQAIA